jgi:hypothetical protein
MNITRRKLFLLLSTAIEVKSSGRFAAIGDVNMPKPRYRYVKERRTLVLRESPWRFPSEPIRPSRVAFFCCGAPRA